MQDAGRVQEVLSQLNRDHDRGYELERPLSGGYQGGAWLVVDADLGPAVLKIADDPEWAGRVERAAPWVADARACGWPTPAWLITGRTDVGAVYVLQSYAIGEAQESITDGWLDGVLPVIDGQAGRGPSAAPDHAEFDRAIAFSGGAGYAATVAAAGPAGADVVRAAAELTAPFADVTLPVDDLVHGDLNPGNVLWRDGVVVALVDVEALGRGSRLHDLATVIVYAWLWGDRASVPRVLAHAGTTAEAGQLEISVVAVLLGVLEFGTRHWPDDEFALICRQAAALLDDLGR